MAASDARALASRLAAADDTELNELFRARRVSPAVAWDDLFDAAEALLDPTSVQRGFTALPRADVLLLDAAMHAGADAQTGAGARLTPGAHPDTRDAGMSRLRRLGFLGDDGAPFAAVRSAWPETIPDPTAPPRGPSATDPVTAERAFRASASLADILHVVARAPLTRTGTGALGANDRRRLVEAGAADDPAGADELLAIAERTGLVAGARRQWRITADALAWLRSGTLTRWVQTAQLLRARLPAGILDGGGWIDPARWPGAYPLAAQWPDDAARLTALMHRWGLIGPDGAAPRWAADFARGGGIDVDALQALLPVEVDRLFLQNDLTAIAPGPLAPHLDVRLRTMARREARAEAATYRFGADTLSAALTGGETAASIRDFLQEISLTGLPQPLAYEIDRTAARHGAIRVGPGPDGAARITGDDPALLAAIEVDQTLHPLGLVTSEGALHSGAPVETVFWMLVDARYPVVAVDADDVPRHVDRVALATEPVTDPAMVYASLIAHLRETHERDTDAAWLERELDQAVRAREVLTLVVRLPDGAEREVTLEAAGLGGGRLRGRDPNADVERTLPVSSIVTVTHLPPPESRNGR